MSAAKKLAVIPRATDGRECLADKKIVITGEARSLAVAKFRELADKLEAYELDGARVQWRAGLPEIETVTVDDTTVQLTKFTIEEV